MDGTGRHAGGEHVLHPPPLGLYVELGQVGRGGEHDEDPQRSVDGQRPWWVGHLEVADEWRALGLRGVRVRAAVEEQLPGQPGDRRGVGELQPQPEPFPRLTGGVLAPGPRERTSSPKTASNSAPPSSVEAFGRGSAVARRIWERPGSSLRSRFSSPVASKGIANVALAPAPTGLAATRER